MSARTTGTDSQPTCVPGDTSLPGDTRKCTSHFRSNQNQMGDNEIVFAYLMCHFTNWMKQTETYSVFWMNVASVGVSVYIECI